MTGCISINLDTRPAAKSQSWDVAPSGEAEMDATKAVSYLQIELILCHVHRIPVPSVRASLTLKLEGSKAEPAIENRCDY
jgi:hypothetical protein